MKIADQIAGYLSSNYAAWASAGYRKNRTIADEALARAEMCPDRVVIYLDDGSSLTYRDVITEALAIAAAFQQLGLHKGDVVSFQLPNWREVVTLNIAAAYLGLVLCPIIPIYRAKEVLFILKATRSKLHLTMDAYRGHDYRAMLEKLKPELVDLQDIVYVRPADKCTTDFSTLVDSGRSCAPAVRPTVDPDSVKLILYTSGTTGNPKGVLHSHNTVHCTVDHFAIGWEMDAEDVMLMPSPVAHITGLLFGLEAPFCLGTRTALMEKWNAEEALTYIHRVKATVCVGATPFLQELVGAARRLHDGAPSMRLFGCGGASVPPELIKSVGGVLSNCRAFRGYGSTETPIVTIGFSGEGELNLAAHTDGKVDGYDVKIVNAQGNTVAPGAEGEILIRGPSMFMGYFDPADNASAFDDAGYFRSGDLGYITPEGAIVITGRSKDLIIRGGENISAKEIEDVLYGHPAVQEAAVVSMPHARLGEGICAYVIPKDEKSPPTLADLASICDAAGLAKQKWPERVEIVTAFPRTAAGKIKKYELRAQILQKLDHGKPIPRA